MTGKICETCPRHCVLAGDAIGACGARMNMDGVITAANYGIATSLALDPIEKKPLARFHPGSRILSVGSFGCNLFCPFCQNYDISRAEAAKGGMLPAMPYREVTPEELVELAVSLCGEGNIGIAFTYNEPLVGWEFVRDTAKMCKETGLVTAIVTNGCAEDPVLDAVLPYTDALNIDLKAFTEEGYERLGGKLETVKHTIARAASVCHVEVTSLIVPGLNDSAEEMAEEAAWLSGIDPEIPLHITRYFPRYRMTEGGPTDRTLMEHLRDIAREKLRDVLLGNV